VCPISQIDVRLIPIRLRSGWRSRTFACLLTAVAFATNAWALPDYEIVPLGLTDAEHTSATGQQSSSILRYTEAGFVTGSSQRYVGGGDSVWIHDPATGTTSRIGLFGPGYTSSFGYQSSRAGTLTETGQVIGNADLYTGFTNTGNAAYVYDAASGTNTRLGFFDAAHTRSDGYQFSAPNWLRAPGYAAGRSVRFSGANSSGETAWFYDVSSATQSRLGYVDATHVRSDGYQFSSVGTITSSGLVTGGSNRFQGMEDRGSTSWLYDAATATTTRLGFYDAEHTAANGEQFTNATFLLESGRLAGYSRRYVGATYAGTSAWVRDTLGITHRVGLTDAEHTGTDGYQNSRVSALAESGYAVGYADRFSGATALGRSAWLSDSAGASLRIGLVDAEHTRSDGYRYSDSTRLTESGYAVGTSSRFIGMDARGQSAWLHDAASAATTRLGFVDAAHTRSDGSQSTFLGELTESGYVTGASYRYGGATDLGQSSWLYDASAGTSVRLGFYDAAHTFANGYQYSFANQLTESGYAAGYSRLSTSNGISQSAWLYAAPSGTTTRLGLLDATHTRSDGNQLSGVTALTESGFVAGTSSRFSGMADRGTTAWVYDATTETTDSILLSVRSDGYAFSSVSVLSEEGLALGSYRFYDAGGSDLGLRAFAWTPEEGAVDLGSLAGDGLAAEGWSYLASAIHADGLGRIIGAGRLATGGDLAYLLNPVAIPEPGSHLLAMLGLLGISARARLRGSARPCPGTAACPPAASAGAGRAS